MHEDQQGCCGAGSTTKWGERCGSVVLRGRGAAPKWGRPCPGCFCLVCRLREEESGTQSAALGHFTNQPLSFEFKPCPFCLLLQGFAFSFLAFCFVPASM